MPEHPLKFAARDKTGDGERPNSLGERDCPRPPPDGHGVVRPGCDRMGIMTSEPRKTAVRAVLEKARLPLRIPGLLLIVTARFYQKFISPMLGPHCRFSPSCSEYFIESVRKYGAIRGTCRGIWRICRCNPWNPGGYDPP